MLWRAAACAGQRRPGQGRAVRDGQTLRHRRLLRGRRQGAAAARRLRLPAGVRAGEDRPRSAGAPDPGRDQRDHAGGHRARGRDGLAAAEAAEFAHRHRKERPDDDDRVPGLGNMGGPMAANLVAAGHTVRGFDPVPAAAAAAQQAARRCSTPPPTRSTAPTWSSPCCPTGDRETLLRRGTSGREARCAVHRHLHDLGQRRPRGARPGRRTRHGPARRAGFRRGEGRRRRNAGLHGRR